MTTNTETLTWRELANIPNLIPPSSLIIRASEEDPARAVLEVEGKDVMIRFKRTSGLAWYTFKVIKIARVYGETQILLEKPDGSRNWITHDEISLIRYADANPQAPTE